MKKRLLNSIFCCIYKPRALDQNENSSEKNIELKVVPDDQNNMNNSMSMPSDKTKKLSKIVAQKKPEDEQKGTTIVFNNDKDLGYSSSGLVTVTTQQIGYPKHSNSSSSDSFSLGSEIKGTYIPQDQIIRNASVSITGQDQDEGWIQ